MWHNPKVGRNKYGCMTSVGNLSLNFKNFYMGAYEEWENERS